MSFIKKMTGMVIINNVEETEGQVLAHTPNGSQGKKKKKPKNSSQGRTQQTPAQGIPEDPMAVLNEEANPIQNKEPDFKNEPSCLDHIFFHEKLRILYVVLLCLFLGLVVPYILSSHFKNPPPPSNKGYCGVNITYRMECLPGNTPANESECHQANCCYDFNMGDQYAPMCFHTIPADYGYMIKDPSEGKDIVTVPEQARDRSHILYTMESDQFTLDLEPLKNSTPTNSPAWPLKVLLQRNGEDIVRIKIWNPDHVQDIDDDFVEDIPESWKLDVSVDDLGGQFNISVKRNETGEEIFNSVFGPLIYSEDYMEITARIPSYHIYGLGQRGNYELIPQFSKRIRWALYNLDNIEDVDTISYVSHPFYMAFEDSGMMHGVYLHNAAPVEIGVTPVPAVIFRALGGSIDLRFYAGPTPHKVTSQYVSMIGMPAMPPYWALGYHLCRTSKNATEFESVFNGMVNESLPYESDCVDARLTYPGSFSKLSPQDQQRVQTLKDTGRKFWLTQYPFLTPESVAYTEATKFDVLLKQRNGTYENGTEVNYYGQVEEEAVGYPDFINNDTESWMSSVPSIKDLYTQADGIMLLRNSPLNEVNITNYNRITGNYCTEAYPEFCCPWHSRSYLPYGITDLDNKTLCSSLQHSTLEGDARPHFRSHNVYGWYHHKRTYELRKSLTVNSRPLVTSQSTFPGSGAFGGHFGGNYGPNLVSQQRGLVHILQMGLYGVPMTGVPICGSVNDTKDELRTEWCLRGHQVGSFLPFMMSHYELDHTPRNPPNFQNGFMRQLKYIIRQRYMVLPYIYNLFYEAHKTAIPVVRPLFYEFPECKDCRTVQSQFMLGQGLMVSPVFNSIHEGESVNLQAHFPPGCWYDYYKGTLVSNTKYGETVVLPTLPSDINVHMQGGIIMPLQGNLHEDFNTSSDFRLKPLVLMAALPCMKRDNPPTTTTPPSTSTTPVPAETLSVEPEMDVQMNTSAYGHLFMDDGVTPLDQKPPFHSLTFEANFTSMTIVRLSQADPTLCPDDPADDRIGFTTVIDTAIIYGLGSTVSKASVYGNPVDFAQDTDTYALTARNLGINWCTHETTLITWEFK